MNKGIFSRLDEDPAVYRLCIALILALATAVRAIHFYYDPVLSRDGVSYIMMSQGGASYPWLPPLYIKLIRLLHACGLSYEVAGLSISMAAGILLIIPAMKIAEICLQKRIWGVAFGLILAMAPKLIDLSIEVQRDSLYLLESALILMSVLNGMRGKTIFWGLAGFFMAVAMFTRIETFEFSAVCGIAFLTLLIYKGRPRRELMRGFFLFCAALLLTLMLLSLILDGSISASVSNFHRYILLRRSSAQCL